MSFEVKLRKIDNSVGIVLPKEVLQHLDVEEGASLMITDGDDGSLCIKSNKPSSSPQMNVAQVIMRRYRDTLGELAK